MTTEFTKEDYNKNAEMLGDRMFNLMGLMNKKSIENEIRDGNLASVKVARVVSYSAPNVTVKLPNDNTSFTRRCMLLVRNDGAGVLSANFPTVNSTVYIIQWGENFSQSFAVYLG